MISLMAAVVLASMASDTQPVRRFALIAAANDGGADRVPLRYAQTDAASFAKVLHQLGGLDPKDSLWVLEPTQQELETALMNLEARLGAVKGGSERVEVLVYYSGHSDADGLLLGEQRFLYQDLQNRLNQLPADVRIVVLDSCASGAMTRIKGGKRRPPFSVDAAHRVSGSAVLTSSSEDEAAQESDKIKGSFFTHYLISGLRGAGDVSGDGRVTLNEAYQFAFHETLRRTEGTIGGAQHPAYSFRLSGSGDVVMTDLRSTAAGLALEEALYGQLFVRNSEGGLEAEVRKTAGQIMQLGFASGTYQVSLLQDGVHYQGELKLVEGGDHRLQVADLSRKEGESTTLRGGGEHPSRRRVVPVDIGIFPMLSVNGFREPVLNHFSLSLGMSYAHDLEGAQLALAVGWLEGLMSGLQAALGFSHAGTGEGVQLGLGFAHTDGQFRGVQAGLGFAASGGSMDGAQLSLGTSIAREDVRGFQGSLGVGTIGKSLEGMQASLGVNVVGGPTRGGQLGVGVNVAQDLEGAQIGVGLNVAQEVSGLQMGLFNIASQVDGLQLGLFNLVDRTEGVSLGLVSYAAQDGILDAKVSSSDVGLFGAALEVGTKSVYTGFHVLSGTWVESDALGFAMALGTRPRLDELWSMDFELAVHVIDQNTQFLDPEILSSVRVLVALKLAQGIRVFVGPALHVLVDVDEQAPSLHALAPSYAFRPEDDRVYLWPGVSAGLRFF